MIMGIGVDTVNIERFERIITETPAFVRRIFTPNERSMAIAIATAEYLSDAEMEHLRKFNPESYRLSVIAETSADEA